ncbi:MAG: hypothetical protein U0271_41195 [Polyangiaceae bacterium]
MTTVFARLGLTLAFLLGCGAKVVYQDSGDGGAGGSGTSSSTSTSTGGFCTSHEECAPLICVFSTGECRAPCTANACESCGEGLVCEGCATSSCPACDDCRGACVPTTEGRCDDDDPCPGGGVCLFQSGFCANPCDAMGQCGQFEFCDECATSSCCGCKNCGAACVGGR